ncbi:MAG TPA: 2-phosphosulfolactate phosphatase [Methylomusa anaerophila]|uniref:Probable 2-phosphosulfolactate phosphatase n=1 Tax=Methylomusa anaerophila TaxID=1930071 RepID=A0A348AP22_9FIRM|nr:2-phosphosulfolactate phosphatase [Methylomusa anaerophila]BBB92820.1 putative 2-phosphosulfolactate phosphatase [Methylomusa anaerophila]HML87340.1 2-phosphosulfolactate phosphatase [Methylomusa anaerophila]
MKIDVCFSINEYTQPRYLGYSAVVIDVLRATTSIATALHNGCMRLIPVETVEQAIKLKHDRYQDALLAGERKGQLIPGFNLGNSPYEYTKEVVLDKTIIMTTTNGTLALSKARNAEKVFTASFVNADAVARKLYEESRDIVVLCAGTEGRFSLEDALCAGLLAERLTDRAWLSDSAMAAQAMYRDFRCDLVKKISASSHAQYLFSIGYGDDVAFSMEHDAYSVVPQFREGQITA